MSPEFVKRFATDFKIILNAVGTYSAKNKITDKITYFAAEDNDSIVIKLWQQHSKQPIDIYSIPGNHLTLLEEPNANKLASHLNALLSPF